jgi:pimeloyl-ACP methyl ester carboxylesterase
MHLGTESVVRDIDYLSRLIEGEDKPINWYGFSYGTIIGQYLIKVLPPHRIGRVIIDGVVNPTSWVDYPKFAPKRKISPYLQLWH